MTQNVGHNCKKTGVLLKIISARQAGLMSTISQQTNSEFQSFRVQTFSLLRLCMHLCSLIVFLHVVADSNAYTADINRIRSSDLFLRPSARRAAGKTPESLLIKAFELFAPLL